ncbi:MAG: phospholipid carrier-dependent glycosyltransferase [Planctomycetota bacterium]
MRLDEVISEFSRSKFVADAASIRVQAPTGSGVDASCVGHDSMNWKLLDEVRCRLRRRMIPSDLVFHLFTSLRRLLATTWPSAVVAVAAWVSVVVCIDPAGSYPNMPEGPGLTVDEIFNVEQGVLLVEQARSLGWLNLVPGTSVEAFKPENHYLPDHPPLGRYWLGVHHHLTWWLAPPFEPEGPFVTACARTGSATAFGLTVWLIGIAAASWFGRAAGLFASLALVLMPRVYGHAHLASLETITNLTCTAAVLAVAAWWNGAAPPSRRVALLTGVVMGLALLTKIQAVLIPIPVILWALWRWRAKAIVPLLVWGVTANVVFFVLWPYLWLDPIGHYLEYLGRATNRATIHCFYFGVRYADKAVPWHYPFVMFAVTVPVGLHVIGVLGLRREKSEVRSQKSEGGGTDDERRRVWLLLACTVFPLIVFALPGVAVYDGERLFLTVFPLWAIFVGRGAARWFAADLSRCGRRVTQFSMTMLVLLQLASNCLVHPCYLSYYNMITVGILGAEPLGLEMNYWGDALTRELLTQAVVQRGTFTQIELHPTLHQFQHEDLWRQSPILRKNCRKLAPESATGLNLPLALVYRRRADLDDSAPNREFDGKGAIAIRQWGVRLSDAPLRK